MGSIIKSLAGMFRPMKRFKVVLNVGHSEKQGGATSPLGTSEWQFNRRLADLIVQFNNAPIDYSIVTQSDTLPLAKLPDAINALSPMLVVSLHANAFDTTARGSEVLYTERLDIATAFLAAIKSVLNLPDRGTKKLERGDRGFFLIDNCLAPCFILEPFFIDNQEDYQVAQKNAQVLAQKIAKTVADVIAADNGLVLKRWY